MPGKLKREPRAPDARPQLAGAAEEAVTGDE